MLNYTPAGEYSLIGISINPAPNEQVELIMGIGSCNRSTKSNRDNLTPPLRGEKISKTLSLPELKNVFKDLLIDSDLNHGKIKDFKDFFSGLKFKAKIDSNGAMIKAWIEKPPLESSLIKPEDLRALL
ncbi:hypothetical protein SAMN04487787_110133 [Kosakonia sacchari]|nr:hypothetical protein SAMN04487787_110133 [Kosakonia sacchari]